jgi:transcriptional regulator with PAS, ATPase and Fis domain
MQKEDLQLFEFVEFRPDQGTIYCKGERMLLTNANNYSILQKQLSRFMGEDDARKIQRRCGYSWGFNDYLTAEMLFGKGCGTSPEGRIIGPRFAALMGFMSSDPPQVEEGSEPTSFRIHQTYRDSLEAEEYILNFGCGESPACSLLVGYASGYCSAAFGIEIYYEEQRCKAQGYPCCDVIGQDVQRWGDEADRLRSEFGFVNSEEVAQTWREQRRLRAREIREHKTNRGIKAGQSTREDISRAQALELAKQEKYIVREDAMLDVLEQALSVTHFNTPVLVHGETGSGKEFIVKLIHQQSARAKEELISLNCSALTETLLESELFGHVRGAFTGAVADRPGLFELASEGTLFLDEIGDMPLNFQAKLLRVLENGEVRRVGSSRVIHTNARILTATHHDLRAMVAAGTFRQDLYFRLNCFVLELPPLRVRRESIVAMTQYFLVETSKGVGKSVSSVTPEVMSLLLSYEWPGNVRELKHVIEHAVLVARNGVVQTCDLPAEITHPVQVQENTKLQKPQTVAIDLKAGERQIIEEVLTQYHGNRMAVANALNISVSTLWRKMRRYQLLGL